MKKTGHKKVDTASQALQFAFGLLFQFLQPKNRKAKRVKKGHL